MSKFLLYQLILLGISTRIYSGIKANDDIKEHFEKALADQAKFGKKLAEKVKEAFNRLNYNFAVANHSLTGLYNHSLTVFSGQVESVQNILKNPLTGIEKYRKNELEKLARYQKLISDLNNAINKNNAACKRNSTLLRVYNSVASLFQTFNEVLPLFLKLQATVTPHFNSDVTTCAAIEKLPSSCASLMNHTGILKIRLEGVVFEVLCEQDGWTVIMNRFRQRDTPFENEKEHGNLCGEFLLDSEPLKRLLRQEPHLLQVEIFNQKANKKIKAEFVYVALKPTTAKNENDVTLTAFRAKRDINLTIRWMPFQSNLEHIEKMRIRPASMGF